MVSQQVRESTDNYQIFHKECVLQRDNSKSSLKISQSKILIQDPENIFNRKEFDALDLQGTYPVIYIDFKNCKADVIIIPLKDLLEQN
jgi:hypothetical protein